MFQTSIAQPAPPGSSTEHWATKSFSAATATFVVVAVLTVFVRRHVLKTVQENVSVRVIIYLSEALAAVGLSFVASYFDVFKKSTYIPTPQYQPDWHVLFWSSIWAAVAGVYFAVKYIAIQTKEGEDFKSKQLSRDLEKEKAAVTTLNRQRELLVRITNFAKQMVSRKIERLSAVAAKEKISIDEFVDKLDPRFQIQSMVKLIHEFFKRPGSVDSELRLALWMKSNGGEGPENLSVAYSWNGEKDDCFSNRSIGRMKLADPLGTRCEIVKCYQSIPQSIKIIPDCGKAAADGDFEYFYPEQKEKVRSLLVYKHIFMQQRQPVAVVLLLVSKVTDHFKKEDKEEIKQFLDEMLTRIEMEWIVLVQLARSWHWTRHTATLPGWLAATKRALKQSPIECRQKGVSTDHSKSKGPSSLYISMKTPISDLPSFGRLALLFSKLKIHKAREKVSPCRDLKTNGWKERKYPLLRCLLLPRSGRSLRRDI